MTRKPGTPLLLATLIIATAFLSGCEDKVFLTVFADPPTIALDGTSTITAVVKAGKNTETAKPVEAATVNIWIPTTEEALAKLSATTVTTDKQGTAAVKLTALGVKKTVHITTRVKDKVSNCKVVIR
ncbi:hypothetical protein FJZ31_03255 [Candidatus Poribacteria bacterium]|nr:hypothetical protein [Candidatus Poribacteria bacterium]